ncbi:MAG: hypothetical protein NXH75_17555 [Halobacteriovoraceae bacterium]|nr:hypothetical protein [Halobacteriovoraceae bacterium]
MVVKIATLYLLAFTAFAGVGGIAGGTEKFQKGSHITFLKDSTWVNVLFSRTLCHDRHDFQAVVRKCVLWKREDDNRKCVEYEKVKIYQPKEDTRQRCDKYEDDTCVRWKRVPLVQSPKRIVEIKDNDDNIKDIKKVIIPTCN